jgi:hypothetical protein
MLNELTHVKDIMDTLHSQAAEPFVLSPNNERIILDRSRVFLDNTSNAKVITSKDVHLLVLIVSRSPVGRCMSNGHALLLIVATSQSDGILYSVLGHVSCHSDANVVFFTEFLFPPKLGGNRLVAASVRNCLEEPFLTKMKIVDVIFTSLEILLLVTFFSHDFQFAVK